jgi:hypothetical protein
MPTRLLWDSKTKVGPANGQHESSSPDLHGNAHRPPGSCCLWEFFTHAGLPRAAVGAEDRVPLVGWTEDLGSDRKDP